MEWGVVTTGFGHFSDIFDFASVVVPLTSSSFKVEHEIFHVQTELAQGVLDQMEDSTSTVVAVDYLCNNRFDLFLIFGWQAPNGVDKLKHFLGHIIVFRRSFVNWLIHS
jgi:hypothetical protein